MKTFAKVLMATVFVAGLATAASAKTLIYCSEGSPEGFNPAFYTSGTSFDASSRPIFNRLIEIERGTTKMVPGLAESWQVSANGLEYTFKLRAGVKFHPADGFKATRDFNADDVVFTFMRQLSKDHPYHKVGGGTYQYFNSKGLGATLNADGTVKTPALLKEVVKVDPMTVKFVLAKPEVTFAALLSMDFASVGSAEYADFLLKAGTPEKFDLKPIGTGPYRLVDYQKDATIRYAAFPEYWQGKAKIDTLIYAITKDPSVALQKLRAGECHLIPYPAPADIASIKTDPKLNLIEAEGFNVGYLGYNVEKKPLNDVRVRKALNMAIDKKAIIAGVYQGAGVVAKNPIPPALWSYNNAVVDDAYNVDGAKKLLAEAGVAPGTKINIWAMPVVRPYNPGAKRMAEMIQADWKKVGIESEIVSYEWADYLERVRVGEQDAFMLGWTADIADPDNFLAVLLSCDSINANNRARWCHKPFDDLINKAKATTDVAERTKLYEQAQVVFKEQAPWATIAHSVVQKAMRKEVIDFKISPFGHHVFYDVDIKE